MRRWGRPWLLFVGETLAGLVVQGCGLNGVGDAQDDAAAEATVVLDATPDIRGSSVNDTVPGAADAPADAAREAPLDGGARDGAEVGADVAEEVGPDVQDVDSGCPTCGVRSVCARRACVPARRVFVSSYLHDGNMGGAANADTSVCGIRATQAGLGGTWMAWISDATNSVSARFSHANVGYYLVDGTQIAVDWSGLTSAALLHVIDIDAYGATTAGVSVWTGTAANGSLIASCNNFSSNNQADTGTYGNNAFLDGQWTNAGTATCNSSMYLYCVEQ